MNILRNAEYIFGPVPSRRLGRSLGVDLVPFKTCSFDCIFCQLGRTTSKTMERREYVPVDNVIRELADWLRLDEAADYITLAGSGEPTLNTRFADVIDFVHASCDIPVALLTNGTTLSDPAVLDQAARADLVKVSLSAWDQASLQRVNRPCEGITLAGIVDGQRRFRQEFPGELWLEVFLVDEINAAHDDVLRIANIVRTINPDRVHLNTAVRPPAEEYAYALDRDALEAKTGLFDPPAEIAAEFSTDRSGPIRTTEASIFFMLQRRPCTSAQIAEVFSLHLNTVSKYIGKLLRTNRIRADTRDGEVYYTAREQPRP